MIIRQAHNQNDISECFEYGFPELPTFEALQQYVIDEGLDHVVLVDGMPITAEGERAERDKRLSEEVDPIVSNPLRWADLTEAKQTEWTTYRTDLLNVPQQAGFPNTITWPTKPE